MASLLPEPRGRNRGCYAGESIDVGGVVRQCVDAALRHGWTLDPVGGSELIAVRREAPQATRRFYLSAGIHGDEPAGTLAALQLLEEDLWPVGTSIWMCPCLNPSGMRSGVRENASRIDLNRDYREANSAEVRDHKLWLDAQPRFDLALCLHEDWEALGFYLYELRRGTAPSYGRRIIEAVSTVCPIDRSTRIDGREASGGIITPSIDVGARLLWPEAVHLFATKCDNCLTLESPSDFAMDVRARTLVAAVRASLTQP